MTNLKLWQIGNVCMLKFKKSKVHPFGKFHQKGHKMGYKIARGVDFCDKVFTCQKGQFLKGEINF